MLIATCDDEKSERERVGGILVQKMKKRGEPLQTAHLEQREDLIEQYGSEDQCPGHDLIFMDVYLQRLSGMEVIHRLCKHDRNVAVIFMPSSPGYAIENCNVWADGHLLRPIARDKVENVLNRFVGYRYPKNKESLLMVNRNSSRRISYGGIMYTESRRMSLRIVYVKGVEYTTRKKLDEVQAELTQPRFLKCNQGYIISMGYITRADTDFTMENSDRVPIRVRERKRIREKYLTYVLERGWDDM